jgi:hypothetical protein
MTPAQWAHAETLAQMLIGTLLAQSILALFGVPLHEALALNAVMFGVSYLRTYAIRRAFAALHTRRGSLPGRDEIFDVLALALLIGFAVFVFALAP